MKTGWWMGVGLMLLTVSSVAQPYVTYGGHRQETPNKIRFVGNDLVVVGSGMEFSFPNISDGFVLIVSKNLDSLNFVYHTDTADTELYLAHTSVDGQLYVCGGDANYCCDTLYDRTAYLVRLNPDYSIDTALYYGGVFGEAFEEIIVLDSSLYLFGYTQSFTTEVPGPNSLDPYVVKLNLDGSVVWEKNPGTVAFDSFSGAALDASGIHFLCVGGSAPQFGADPYSDGYVVKLDTAANVVWRKTYKSGFQRTEFLSCLTALPDGGGIAAGYAYDEATEASAPFIIRFTVNGDTVWTRVPYRFNEPSNSTYNQRWRESEISDVIYLSDGNFVFTGDWYNAAASTRDIFICKYSLNGDSLWRIDLGDDWADRGHAVTEDDEGFIYVAGSYVNPLTANGGRDVLLIKLDANGCTVDTCLISNLLQPPAVSTNAFTIYPNPAEDHIRIERTNPLSQGSQLFIRDLNGRIILHQPVSHNKTINIESLSNGVYVVELMQRNGERFYQRFVKQ